jgi:hypothetical protein
MFNLATYASSFFHRPIPNFIKAFLRTVLSYADHPGDQDEFFNDELCHYSVFVDFEDFFIISSF